MLIMVRMIKKTEMIKMIKLISVIGNAISNIEHGYQDVQFVDLMTAMIQQITLL